MTISFILSKAILYWCSNDGKLSNIKSINGALLIIIVFPIFFGCCCKKKSNNEKIIGTWVADLSMTSGYQKIKDTLIFGKDSLVDLKNNTFGRGIGKFKYFIIKDTLFVIRAFPNKIPYNEPYPFTFLEISKIKFDFKDLVSSGSGYYLKITN